MLMEARTEVAISLPPEWAPQSAVMLTWPHRESIWADMLDQIDEVYVDLSREISRREKLVITCFDHAHQNHIKELLREAYVDMQQVQLYLAYSNDVWVRDHGPLCVMKRGKPLLLDFIFNGWGNKYPANFDDNLTRSLQEQQAFGDIPLQTIDLVLEGGAIEVDGAGTLLTTTRCLPARNPKLSKEALTAQLKQLFGCDRVLWLAHGYLAGDDTDSHIDTLARFINPHTICYVRCEDPDDEHYVELQLMEKELKALRDSEGKPYKLIPLPFPRARFAKYDGRRLPLSYANFLIINNAVLAPTYGDPADRAALDILQHAFLSHEVIGIPAQAAVEWYGSLHCLTMQLPEGVIK